MRALEVAEMRALLATVGVRRCAGTDALPLTQCGEGAAACGCGAKSACFFTIIDLEKKVRALSRLLATAASL